MKKKIIIPIIICILLVVGIVLFLLLNKVDKNDDLTTITIEINPSIEIKLKEDVVKEIKALNEDGEKVLEKELKGESLEETLKWIMNKSIEFDFIKGEATVLVQVDGEYDLEKLRGYIGNPLGEKNVPVEIIIVNNVTKEDEKLAKDNNISVARAHLINELVNELGINASDYINKPIRELNEMVITGHYCDNGYTLVGTLCKKKIKEEEPKSGKVCPDKTYEYKGKCYESTPVMDTDNLICRDDYVLKDGKCTKKITENAIPAKMTCPSGEPVMKSDVGLSVAGSGEDSYVCVDYSKAKEPVLRCLYNSGHIMIDGKCYNGPAPVINGGCPNGDTLRNGWCYSLDTNDQYQCPDGRIYEKSKGTLPKYCPDTLKTSTPTISEYKCNEGFALEGTKCTKDDVVDPEHERTCSEGYTLVDNSGCINMKVVKEKVDGLVCEGDYELEGDKCIYYEIENAKSK